MHLLSVCLTCSGSASMCLFSRLVICCDTSITPWKNRQKHHTAPNPRNSKYRRWNDLQLTPRSVPASSIEISPAPKGRVKRIGGFLCGGELVGVEWIEIAVNYYSRERIFHVILILSATHKIMASRNGCRIHMKLFLNLKISLKISISDRKYVLRLLKIILWLLPYIIFTQYTWSKFIFLPCKYQYEV